MVTSRYFLFLRIFHLPFSFDSTSFYFNRKVFECLARFKVALTMLSMAVLAKEVNLNALYKVNMYFGWKMFFQKRDVYPSNVWFITVAAFQSVGLLRNDYFKIRSNAPSNLLCNVWNFIFLFALADFLCLSNVVFSSKLCSFFIILRCNCDFWAVFWGLFSAWFCCYQTEKVCGSIYLVWNKTETKEIHF